LHLQVFGCFGSRIPPAQLTVRLFTPDGKPFTPDGGRGFAKEGEGLILKGVPAGVYKLQVWDAGGAVGERDLVVNTKDVWARLGLDFPSGDHLGPGGGLEIGGEIRPAPSDGGDWWVRVEGVYISARREGPVTASGKFWVAGLGMGTYLVEIFEGTKLRHSQTLEISPKRPTTHLSVSIPAGDGER
jgi:hypothetical protein